jgi:hypothetical protein
MVFSESALGQSNYSGDGGNPYSLWLRHIRTTYPSNAIPLEQRPHRLHTRLLHNSNGTMVLLAIRHNHSSSPIPGSEVGHGSFRLLYVDWSSVYSGHFYSVASKLQFYGYFDAVYAYLHVFAAVFS